MISGKCSMKSYDADFLSPGMPGTGRAVDALEQGVLVLAEERKHLSPRDLKTEIFEYLLDNMRVGSAPDDFFPAFGLWGHKPFEPILFRNFAERKKEIGLPEAVSGEISCFMPDFAHSVPDWQRILELGFSGILARAGEAEISFCGRIGGSEEKRHFFRSVTRAYEAILRCMKRLLRYEESSGADPKITAAIRHLICGRAGSFYEALLQIWCYYQFSEYADCLQTRSFGNWDQLLYPYFLHDRESGVTEETFRALLCNFMGKIQSMHYYWGHPFYLGGTRPDGSSAVNELSYLILDEYDKQGFFDPKIQIKIDHNTPVPFLNKVLDMIRRGHNSLVLVGEPCIRRTMLKAGYTEEEARTAVIKGCYEYTECRSSVETAPFRFVLPKIVNDALRACRDAEDFDSFLDFLEKKIDGLCRDVFPAVDRMESMMEFFNPVLMLSGVSERALELGIDGYAAAPRHAHTNIWLAGPATAADSLCAVRRFVFEKKALSIPELLRTLDSDWKGSEELHREILNDPCKFGNHDPEADAMLARLLKMFTSRINGRKNTRGGFYTTALHAADSFLKDGRRLEATPDGRRRGEEFSKNLSPQPGRCRNGATALLLSALTLDSSEFAADFPVDVTLNPSAVRGEEGLAAMRALVMTYIRNFGHAIHFNVFDVRKLEEAKRHPEKYPEFQIRVCGWNVLWNNLSEQEQTAYLAQAYANEGRMV